MSDTVRMWRHIQQRYNLVGSKCNECGDVFFPSRVVCPNCRRKGKLEPFQFSGKGKIYTYSVIRSPPKKKKKIAPYAVAVIELKWSLEEFLKMVLTALFLMDLNSNQLNNFF